MSEDILEALEMYANKNRQLFVEIVKQSLNEIFGDATAETLIYYLGGNEALNDPNTMTHKLRAILGMGTDAILRYMMKEMSKRI